MSAKSRRHHFLLRNGSWSIPISATDIGRYFTLDFCCLNTKILLVSYQLQDSLAFKLVKRLNIYVIISFILCSYIYIPLGSLFSEKRSFCKVLGKQVKFSSLYCFTFSLCIFIFLLSYELSEEFSPENE